MDGPYVIKLINLCIQFPLCQPTLLANICKIFAWKDWDDLSLTASSYAVRGSLPLYDAFCDGCERDLGTSTGRFVCKSCKDINLCSTCFKIYEVDGMKAGMKTCQDHHFLKLSKIGLKGRANEVGLSVEQWLQELLGNMKDIVE
jgi:hypothetical protein